MAASISAGMFRMVIMPIDAVKTSIQVGGSLKPLLGKIKASGGPLSVVWHLQLSAGAAAAGPNHAGEAGPTGRHWLLCVGGVGFSLQQRAGHQDGAADQRGQDFLR